MDAESNAARARFSAINELLSREAGYSVAKKCLEVQAAAELRDPTLRTETSVTLSDEARSWYVGALGEKEVGRALSTLGDGWMVRHAVPIGSGTKDIDHLVIGPPGVFAINTKHHIGAKIWIGDHVLKVNGANQRHIASARSDAADVARRLSLQTGFAPSVTPVVALVGHASIVDGRKQSRDFPVVADVAHLVAWLSTLAPTLATAELGLIALAAEEPSTWHTDPAAAQTSRVMQRFDRLVSEVGPGSRPRGPAITGSAPGSRVPVRAASAARTRSPRPVPATRPTSKREAARRARRREELAKLLVLGVAALTSPLWLPGAMSALIAFLTPG